jgi:hypothetical protein
MEIKDVDNDGYVDRGFGTFIVANSRESEVSHQAPHPIADSTTEAQAIEVFKATESRTFLMAGTHRLASSTVSTCQGAYSISDPAHNVDNMFFATNQQLDTFYGVSDWTAIQWHGMAAATCPTVNVFLSHGIDVAPGATDKIAVLRDALLAENPSWSVGVPGSGVCTLLGSTNTEGRWLNGVTSSSTAPCSTAATGSPTQKYIFF